MKFQYWNIISASKTANISWKLLGTHKSYKQSSKRCLLCLNQKLAIAQHKDHDIPNKSSEVINKCSPLIDQKKFRIRTLFIVKSHGYFVTFKFGTFFEDTCSLLWGSLSINEPWLLWGSFPWEFLCLSFPRLRMNVWRVIFWRVIFWLITSNRKD